MDELAILASIQQVLEEHYAQGDCSLHSLNTRSLDDDRIVYKMYRVDAPGSPSWIVFAAHDDLIAGRTFRWETFLSPKLWQEQHATLLTILADNHYPAPRVIPSLCGNLVTSQGPWHLLVTTFLDGQAGGVSSEHLARLAGALGRLHSLPFPKDLPVGFSRWNRAYSIPHALELLERVKADVPISHSILYHQCEQILQTVGTYLESAPHVLVHGDCWPPNSVRMGQQDVALIDWEGAGKGASILDFGSLTLTCQYDQYGGMPNTGDPQRVATVVTSYRKWYLLSSSELDILPEALSFRVAWTGAWMFSRLPQEGWSARLEEFFARIKLGLDLASQTTQIVQAFYGR